MDVHRAARIMSCLALVADLGRFVMETARSSSFAPLMERALALPGGAEARRARALLATALTRASRDGADAIAALTHAERQLRDHGELHDAIFARAWRGGLLVDEGRAGEGAIALIEEALGEYDALGDTDAARVIRGQLGYALMSLEASSREEQTRLVDLFRDLVDESRDAGDLYDAATNAANLASVLADAGSHADAARAAHEALQLARAVDAQRDVGWVAFILACAAEAADRHEEALTLVGATRAVARETGGSGLTADAEERITALERRLRARVDSEAADTLAQRGEAMTLDDVFDYCLALPT
jgi:tetratricopeptide (TPR) repeat protein